MREGCARCDPFRVAGWLWMYRGSSSLRSLTPGYCPAPLRGARTTHQRKLAQIAISGKKHPERGAKCNSRGSRRGDERPRCVIQRDRTCSVRLLNSPRRSAAQPFGVEAREARGRPPVRHNAIGPCGVRLPQRTPKGCRAIAGGRGARSGGRTPVRHATRSDPVRVPPPRAPRRGTPTAAGVRGARGATTTPGTSHKVIGP